MQTDSLPAELPEIPHLTGHLFLFDLWIVSYVIFLIVSKFEYMYVCAGFPGGSDGKVSACNAGELGLIPGSERCPGEGNGNSSTLA